MVLPLQQLIQLLKHKLCSLYYIIDLSCGCQGCRDAFEFGNGRVIWSHAGVLVTRLDTKLFLGDMGETGAELGYLSIFVSFANVLEDQAVDCRHQVLLQLSLQ